MTKEIPSAKDPFGLVSYHADAIQEMNMQNITNDTMENIKHAYPTVDVSWFVSVPIVKITAANETITPNAPMVDPMPTMDDDDESSPMYKTISTIPAKTLIINVKSCPLISVRAFPKIDGIHTLV